MEWTDVVMTSTSGNEALDKGHAISYVKDCVESNGTRTGEICSLYREFVMSNTSI